MWKNSTRSTRLVGGRMLRQFLVSLKEVVTKPRTKEPDMAVDESMFSQVRSQSVLCEKALGEERIP